jgi:cytochrome P450
MELLSDRQLGAIELTGGRQALLLTAYDQVTEVLRDRRLSSTINMVPPMTPAGDTPGWFFGLDGSEHTRLRRLVAAVFTPRAARDLAPRVAQVVTGCIAHLRRQGPPADLFRSFAWPVAGLVLCDLLRISQEDQAAFESQVERLDQPERPAAQRLAAFTALWQAQLDLVRHKQTHPAGDFLSDLLGGSGGPKLTPAEAASIMLSVRLGGQAPVAHLLAMAVFVLLASTDRTAHRWDDPDWAAGAVEELLRYLPTNNLGLVRVASADMPLGGHDIHRGDVVLMSLPVANRDPATFADPDSLDLSRATAGSLCFGSGPHQCLGQSLARLEIQTALRELFRQLPDLRLAVDPANVPIHETGNTYGVARLPVTW